MLEKFYPADRVDEMLKVASDIMHGLAEFTEQQQGEIDNLRQELNLAKAAAADKISLEKVAKKSISKDAADQFVTFLEDHDIIPGNDREKYAAAICDNAEFALQIAAKAIKLSEPPVSEGFGIKTAKLSQVDKEKALENKLLADCLSITSDY